jgi:hypothetical protein
MAFYLIKSGAEVMLVSDEWESAAGSSESNLDEILRYLALVELSHDAPMPDFDLQTGTLLLSLRQGRHGRG